MQLMMLKLETSSKNPQPKNKIKTLELRTYDWWWSSSYLEIFQKLDWAANASDGIEPKKEDLWGTKNVCLEWFRNFFFSFMFLQLFSYEDHQQQQVLLLLLPIPTNFMSSLCSLFQQSSLLSMSKVRTLVSSSSSSSSSCYRDCVLLSCIHSKRILFYFWVEICLCWKQIECEQGSN
jgi:hypothetical protein